MTGNLCPNCKETLGDESHQITEDEIPGEQATQAGTEGPCRAWDSKLAAAEEWRDNKLVALDRWLARYVMPILHFVMGGALLYFAIKVIQILTSRR